MITSQSEDLKKELGHFQLSETLSQDRIEFYKCFLHDFSSQTRTIKSFTNLIKDSFDFEDQDLEVVNFIARAGDRLEQLFDVFNRMLELEKYSVNLEKLNTQTSLSNIDTFVKVHVDKKDILFCTAGIDSETHFMADRYLLEVCFKEIISNAIKFNKSPKVVIDVSCEKTADALTIHFKDNGVKLSPEMSEEALHYLSKLTLWEQSSGNGSGLSFANKMISMMGAKLYFNKYKKDKIGNCVSLEFKIVNLARLVN